GHFVAVLRLHPELHVELGRAVEVAGLERLFFRCEVRTHRLGPVPCGQARADEYETLDLALMRERRPERDRTAERVADDHGWEKLGREVDVREWLGWKRVLAETRQVGRDDGVLTLECRDLALPQPRSAECKRTTRDISRPRWAGCPRRHRGSRA